MSYVYVVCVLSVDVSLKRTLYSILPSPLKLGYALNILPGIFQEVFFFVSFFPSKKKFIYIIHPLFLEIFIPQKCACMYFPTSLDFLIVMPEPATSGPNEISHD